MAAAGVPVDAATICQLGWTSPSIRLRQGQALAIFFFI